MLDNDDNGKELDTVHNLSKKHHLLEADQSAHEEKVKDWNKQTDVSIENGVWNENSKMRKSQPLTDR